jgi:hypothetical protein
MTRQMEELARLMEQQQDLQAETFDLHRQMQEQRQQQQQQPFTPMDEELRQMFEEMMEEMQSRQQELTEQLDAIVQNMPMPPTQGQQGETPGQGGVGDQGASGQGQGMGSQLSQQIGRARNAMQDSADALRRRAPDNAFQSQSSAIQSLRQSVQTMMDEMYARSGNPSGTMGARSTGSSDPLGRPRRTQGADLGQNVDVPDEIDIERARLLFDAIRERLGERFRPTYELEYLERLLEAGSQ